VNILIFDNYDSFTYNLLHMLEAVDDRVHVDVLRNDQPFSGVWKNYHKVVLSPGPGLPQTSGHLMDFIAEIEGRIPVLGVCLGLQALAVHYGGKLKNLESVLHGKSLPAQVVNEDEPLFSGVPSPFLTGRYHSWVLDPGTLPTEFHITASDASGEVMAIRHKFHDTSAVQFHPESVLTPYGAKILSNWIKT
jgi:anthranilate synthase component 2